jgi:hypothetical protein
LNIYESSNGAHGTRAGGQEHMPVLFGRNELAYHREIIGVVQNKQPTRLRAQQTLDGLNCCGLILGASFPELQEACERRIAGYERLVRMSNSPKSVGILSEVPVGIFHGGLRFPNPTDPAQSGAALSDECFMELHHLHPPDR